MKRLNNILKFAGIFLTAMMLNGCDSSDIETEVLEESELSSMSLENDVPEESEEQQKAYSSCNEPEVDEIKVYLDFDGAKIRKGRGPYRANFIGQRQVTVPSSRIPSSRQKQIARDVQDIYDEVDVAVDVTLNRPRRGPYVTVVIGGQASDLKNPRFGSRTRGLAVRDVGNRCISETVFAFGDWRDPNWVLVNIIAHEVGHSFGLSHIHPKKAIMYPAVRQSMEAFQTGYIVKNRKPTKQRQNSPRTLRRNLP